MITITRSALPEGGLPEWLAQPFHGVGLAWLGQAGFVLRIDSATMLIDPYLSDHLARKYRASRFPHTRLMPAPIAADGFPRVDLVVCTHRHGDHMDPDSLSVLSAQHRDCRFVVPASEIAYAETTLGLETSRLIGAEAGIALRPLQGAELTLHPVPAAHEQLERDLQGRHRFLGYGIEAAGMRLYHSGDCVPYEELIMTVRALAPQLALLPVNGRDVERASGGVPGNFTLEEAMALCAETGIPQMIPHHFGLFAFNTADPAEIDAAASRQSRQGLGPEILPPDIRDRFVLEPTVQTAG